MTDINHPSEAEMMSIRNIFDRAANAIVQASELAKAVSELQSRFDSLTRDFETMLARNNELVQSLQEVRGQRDTAMAERDQAKAEINQLTHGLDIAQTNNSVKDARIAELMSQLEAVSNQRDYNLDQWSKAQEAADIASDKLAKIQHALGLPETPAPEPITERKSDAVSVPINESHNEASAKVDPIEPAQPEPPKHEWDNPFDPNRF